MKDLPKVFAKPIEKEIENNRKMFYSKLIEERKDSKNVLKEIDEIFASRDFVYKKEVEITLKNKDIIRTNMVGKSGHSILTLDGKKINITEIESIKKL